MGAHARSNPGLAIIVFAIKAAIDDLEAHTFVFRAQKTMHGGKHVAAGDTIFVFASEERAGIPGKRDRRGGSRCAASA